MFSKLKPFGLSLGVSFPLDHMMSSDDICSSLGSAGAQLRHRQLKDSLNTLGLPLTALNTGHAPWENEER